MLVVAAIVAIVFLVKLRRLMLSLETDRLLLRAPVPEDADALAPMYADPEVMRYVGDGRTLTRAETERSVRRMIERWEADGFGLFTTVRKDDEAVIGRVGLLVWNTDTWEPTTRAEAPTGRARSRSATRSGATTGARASRPRPPARCATTRSASSAPRG